ncbi:MAG TPA: acyltransferase [Kofleriaceae bacterium]
MQPESGFSWPQGGRIPTLDGIRAVSIGLVLAAHAIGTGALPMNGRVAHMAGDLGVRTFFVLSGFLITTLLMREHRQRGRVSLFDFYVRRAYRIFPAFYAYLMIVGTLALTGAITLLPGDLLAAATYTTNFHAERSWWTGHLWSLAVEEQFYIVWPLLLVVLGLARAWGAALVAMIAAPIVRIAVWQLAPQHASLVDQAFPCVFDALATGCLLALAVPHIVKSERCAQVVASRWFLPAVMLGFAPCIVTNPWIQYGVAMTSANLAIAAIIVRCVALPASRISRTLERRGFVWVGTLSYSLYLWQQLFLNRHSELWMHQFPINVALAFAAATACHYLIERPFLRVSAQRRAAAEARGIAVLGPANEVLDVSDVRSSQIAKLRRPSTDIAPGRNGPRETLS